MKNKNEHPLIYIHIGLWILLLLTFDFLTKRNEFAVWGNDYFDLIYIIFIFYLVCEIWKLKQIGLKNHIDSLSKKTLNWYIVVEFGMVLLACMMSEPPDYVDSFRNPYLLTVELIINLCLITCFTAVFLYLRLKKNPA